MQYCPKLMDMDEDVVVIVEEIPNTIVFMATIHQILKKGKPPRNHENNFYRCGMKGHWLRTCRMLKHLVDLYQTSIKENEVEMNNFVPRRYIIFLILLYNQKLYKYYYS